MNIRSHGKKVGTLEPNGLVTTEDKELTLFLSDVVVDGIPFTDYNAGDDDEFIVTDSIKIGHPLWPKALWYALQEAGFDVDDWKDAQIELISSDDDLSTDELILELIKARDDLAPRLPRGAKKIEGSLLITLKAWLTDKFKQFFGMLTEDMTETEAIDALDASMMEFLQEAQKVILPMTWKLYQVGLNNGIKDTGVDVGDTVHRLGFNWIVNNPNGIMESVKGLTKEQRDSMAKVIHNAFAGLEPFQLGTLKKRLREQHDVGKARAELIIRTEVAKISNEGRLLAWEQDPLRDEYDYYWIATRDRRVKPISLVMQDNSPYDFTTVADLWRNPTTENALRHGLRGAAGLPPKQNDVFNQRCSITRRPKGV